MKEKPKGDSIVSQQKSLCCTELSQELQLTQGKRGTTTKLSSTKRREGNSAAFFKDDYCAVCYGKASSRTFKVYARLRRMGTIEMEDNSFRTRKIQSRRPGRLCLLLASFKEGRAHLFEKTAREKVVNGLGCDALLWIVRLYRHQGQSRL